MIISDSVPVVAYHIYIWFQFLYQHIGGDFLNRFEYWGGGCTPQYILWVWPCCQWIESMYVYARHRRGMLYLCQSTKQTQTLPRTHFYIQLTADVSTATEQSSLKNKVSHHTPQDSTWRIHVHCLFQDWKKWWINN